MSKPPILVTNDDGIQAPGLAALVDALETIGEVTVYAPDREQSAVSHCVSLRHPLRVQEVRERWFSVDGTPADCVMMAVRDLMDQRPVLVVSGVNIGANLGDDVHYSGTVAGAYEAMLLDTPAIAVSDVAYQPEHLETAARVAADLACDILEQGLPDEIMLNVNVPDVPYDDLAGVKLTRMGRRNYPDDIVRREDPRGGVYYWIGGAEPGCVMEPGTDFEAIEQGCASVTPLARDITHTGALSALAGRAAFNRTDD
jgi:5'-nucleotidase